jgi:DNA-binding MarR family transcriptional regulator
MSATGARPRAPRDVTPDAADLRRVAEALARVTRSTRRALQLPLGVTSLAVLVTLADRGPMRLGDLAAHEGITPATLSRVVAVLEEDGYAARRPDPADRRAAILAITVAGSRVLADARAAHADVLAARWSALTAAQRRALTAALPALEALAGG